MLKSLVKEPLLHFLLIGLGLFWLFEQTAPSAETEQDQIIEVNQESLLTFYQYRTRAFNIEQARLRIEAMPADELNRLIEDYVREEALYREALRLGMDQNDYVIKRRLVQSIEFIADGAASAEIEVSQPRVLAYYEAHQADYFVPPVVTFTHVYFGLRDRSEEAAKALARDKLAELNKHQISFSDSTAHGDRFLYHVNYVDRGADLVAGHFGQAMANALFELTPDEKHWQGPFASDYGYHLVLLTRRSAGRIPPLEEIMDRVQEDALREDARERRSAAIQSVVDRYRVRRTYRPDDLTEESGSDQP